MRPLIPNVAVLLSADGGLSVEHRKEAGLGRAQIRQIPGGERTYEMVGFVPVFQEVVPRRRRASASDGDHLGYLEPTDDLLKRTRP